MPRSLEKLLSTNPSGTRVRPPRKNSTEPPQPTCEFQETADESVTDLGLRVALRMKARHLNTVGGSGKAKAAPGNPDLNHPSNYQNLNFGR